MTPVAFDTASQYGFSLVVLLIPWREAHEFQVTSITVHLRVADALSYA
jgi:hypothetical protein